MLKVPTVRKTYVVLLHFENTFPHIETLQKLQQLVPNLPLEVKPPDNMAHLRQFIPIHSVELDDLRLIFRLNP
jgi:hypothetical protein